MTTPANDWMQAIGWTVGVSIVLPVIVLGAWAVGRRYGLAIEGVPDTLRLTRQPWFQRHVRTAVRVFYGMYFAMMVFRKTPIGRVAHGLLIASVLGVALLVAGWSLRCMLTGKARKAGEWIYCISLMGLAAFIAGWALLLCGLDAGSRQ